MAAPTSRPTSVFISYSRTDSATIDRLEAELISYGFYTWVDRAHLEGGDKWAAQIEHAIQASDAVVIGLSPDAVASPWVINELFYASHLKKPLIPILLRPVKNVPLLLAATQYIDLHTDESQGMQQLRLRLLRLGEQLATTASVSSAPGPATVNTPVTQHIAPTLQPHTNDPATQLVAPPQPAPAADLNDLFVQSIAARAHGDLDQAEALLRQVVERDRQFGNGVAAQQLEETQQQLLPFQLERLRQRAGQAEKRGAWGEAIGAWQALLERTPNDTEAKDSLKRDEQNRDAAWLYINVQRLARQQDWPAARAMLSLLMERAPDYGDPEGIGSIPCARCGGENPLFAPFCDYCGVRLDYISYRTVRDYPSDSTRRAHQEQRLVGHVLCSQRHSNPAYAIWCDKCGEMLRPL